MEMIVQKARFVELLQHEDNRVRDCCAKTLGQLFPHTEGVIGPLLQAIRTYPEHCLTLGYHLQLFTPDDDDLPGIIQLCHDTAGAEDVDGYSMHYHALSSFLSAPFEIIERNRELFEGEQELRKQYDIAQHREEVRCHSFEELWNELEELCFQNRGKEMDRETNLYAELLVEGLARHPEQVKNNVITVLHENNPDNYLLEDYLVPLAGTLKLEETIPDLFRILNEVDFMATIHQSCVRALGKIGTLQVLAGIEQAYAENEDLRTHLSGALEYMPYEETEDLAIRLLEREQDIANKTFIASSLCDIFSLKAASPIRELIATRQYDPTIVTLIDHLIPVYVYHDQDADCSQLERTDKEFREKAFKESPLFELREEFGQILEQRFKEPKASAKAKKTVPQKKGKAALKRAKKRKKKKRR